MTTTIALAGKGGVGKTTISAMVIKYLAQTQPGAVLAIDADPSSNLNMVLGLDLDWTVGEIREDMLSQVKQSLTAGGAAMGALSGGLSKHDYLDHHIRSSLAEATRLPSGLNATLQAVPVCPLKWSTSWPVVGSHSFTPSPLADASFCPSGLNTMPWT